MAAEETNTHKKEEDFVSLASHQLRTPLTSIKLFVEMLRNGTLGDLNDAQREVVHNVEAANQRMIQLIDNLLQLSHIRGGELEVHPEHIDLRELIENVIEDNKIVAKAQNIEILFTYEGDFDTTVTSDPHLLSHILNNLIRNAIQYMDVESGEEENIIISLDYDESRDSLVVSVEDNGIGIPDDPEVRKKIFDRFYRAPNAQKLEQSSDGLGLYMCKEFIDRLEGDIWVESEEGEGATFFISVPDIGKGKGGV